MQILCIFCHKREEGFRIGEMMALCLYRWEGIGYYRDRWIFISFNKGEHDGTGEG